MEIRVVKWDGVRFVVGPGKDGGMRFGKVCERGLRCFNVIV